MRLFVVVSLFSSCVSFCWCRLQDDDDAAATAASGFVAASSQCFHQPAEACPLPSERRCKKLKDNATAICCNLDKNTLEASFDFLDLIHNPVNKLHIRNATFDVLNISGGIWRPLSELSITDGYIGEVTGDFGKLIAITCLNLSSNSITKIANRSLVNLYKLTTLDLSHNNLSVIPSFKKVVPGITLDVSDNEQLLCEPLFEVLTSSELHFMNENETSCLSPRTFNWFNTTELVPLKQVLSVHELRTECDFNCSCEPYRLDIVIGKPPTFSVLVNCSGLQLTELPPFLPPNTIALNISNNNISNLDAMNTPSYQHLRELYADNNEITSILPLEGTNFFTNFVVLSLRNNKLKLLPTYILSNVFDRNYNFQHVNLGLNKLQCDCNTAKVLKEWLLAKQKHIPDYEEIYCNNLKSRVIDLDPSKLCQSQQDWTDYIYYIIIAEVLLLVFLIAKVSYDYWVFKTAGYLPWPASQMPKLPCDWLCE